MNVKTYGTVRCSKCGQDLTNKIQVYDYLDKEKKVRVVYCEKDNLKIKNSYYE